MFFICFFIERNCCVCESERFATARCVRERSAQLSCADWFRGGRNPDFSLRLRCGMGALILLLRLHVNAARVIDLSYGVLPASDGERRSTCSYSPPPVHRCPNSCDAASHWSLACSFRSPPSSARRSRAFPSALLRLASESPPPAIAALPVNAPRNSSLLQPDIYIGYRNAMRQRTCDLD